MTRTEWETDGLYTFVTNRQGSEIEIMPFTQTEIGPGSPSSAMPLLYMWPAA